MQRAQLLSFIAKIARGSAGKIVVNKLWKMRLVVTARPCPTPWRRDRRPDESLLPPVSCANWKASSANARSDRLWPALERNALSEKKAPASPFLPGGTRGWLAPRNRSYQMARPESWMSGRLNFDYPEKPREPSGAWVRQDRRSKSHRAWGYGSRSKSNPLARTASAVASSVSSARASGERRSK